jgi:hypothetical protein
MVRNGGACRFGTLLALVKAEGCASNGKHSHDRKRVGGFGLFQVPAHLGLGNDDAKESLSPQRISEKPPAIILRDL